MTMESKKGMTRLSQARWDKANLVGRCIKFNRNTESDLIDYIKTINFSKTVKKLLRMQMEWDKGFDTYMNESRKELD